MYGGSNVMQGRIVSVIGSMALLHALFIMVEAVRKSGHMAEVTLRFVHLRHKYLDHIGNYCLVKILVSYVVVLAIMAYCYSNFISYGDGDLMLQILVPLYAVILSNSYMFYFSFLCGLSTFCEEVLRSIKTSFETKRASVTTIVLAIEEIKETVADACKCFGAVFFWSTAASGELTVVSSYYILATIITVKDVPSIIVVKALVSMAVAALSNQIMFAVVNCSVHRAYEEVSLLTFWVSF